MAKEQEIRQPSKNDEEDKGNSCLDNKLEQYKSGVIDVQKERNPNLTEDQDQKQQSDSNDNQEERQLKIEHNDVRIIYLFKNAHKIFKFISLTVTVVFFFY